jgi:hypothetical protein
MSKRYVSSLDEDLAVQHKLMVRRSQGQFER